MYRTENIDVLGKVMPTLVFEPEGAGPHPWLVIAQHLPVAHAGLEKDPFTIAVGDGQVPCEFHRYDGAGHGFQDSGNAERYREQPSEDAWAKAIGFLDGQLKRGKA